MDTTILVIFAYLIGMFSALYVFWAQREAFMSIFTSIDKLMEDIKKRKEQQAKSQPPKTTNVAKQPQEKQTVVDAKFEKIITTNYGMCNHCHMDINIRNPSGYCDHLYYPENCSICKVKK